MNKPNNPERNDKPQQPARPVDSAPKPDPGNKPMEFSHEPPNKKDIITFDRDA